MNTRNRGFSLVEMIVVALLGSITLMAIYQALIVQEQAYRREGAIIATHDALRTAVGVLESELREVSATAELALGGSDIAMIKPESLEFRALRKIGFVCDSHSGTSTDVWELGEDFTDTDSIMVFLEGDSSIWTDDAWEVVEVGGTGSPTTSSCSSSWTGASGANLTHGTVTVADLRDGAPLRSFVWITYGLYQDGDDWVLGRHERGSSTIVPLVSRLAPPADSGLVFHYYDENGLETDQPDEVARIDINVRGIADTKNDVYGDTLWTTLFLRNN